MLVRGTKIGTTPFAGPVLLNASSAHLSVSAPVRGATVAVDGRSLGVVPAEVALSSGRHRVRLQHPDFQPAETTFELRDGESKRLSLDLERRPGLLQKWWFWAGTGALLAGGAAVVVALTTDRAPDRGDIAPGVVSAPLLRY